MRKCGGKKAVFKEGDAGYEVNGIVPNGGESILVYLVPFGDSQPEKKRAR